MDTKWEFQYYMWEKKPWSHLMTSYVTTPNSKRRKAAFKQFRKQSSLLGRGAVVESCKRVSR